MFLHTRCIQPIALYGAEIWGLKAEQAVKANVLYTIERKMIRLALLTHVSCPGMLLNVFSNTIPLWMQAKEKYLFRQEINKNRQNYDTKIRNEDLIHPSINLSEVVLYDYHNFTSFKTVTVRIDLREDENKKHCLTLFSAQRREGACLNYYSSSKETRTNSFLAHAYGKIISDLLTKNFNTICIINRENFIRRLLHESRKYQKQFYLYSTLLQAKNQGVQVIINEETNFRIEKNLKCMPLNSANKTSNEDLI